MKAIIFGITGQDGSLLANYLLKKNYLITGTTRNKNNIRNLQYLQIEKNIVIKEVDTFSLTQIFKLIENEQPDEIYNMSGQSSVGLSTTEPMETYHSIFNTTLYILESIKTINKKIKFFNPSSTECFGSATNKPFDENSIYNPFSPYATAKSITHSLVNNYRSTYGIHACTGILSNHESYLRPVEFVSKKIIQGAYNISIGIIKELEVGNISIVRDWGWAEEYIEAMYLMMKQDDPDDFIIATGKSITLEQFISHSFGIFNLDYKKHIKINKSLIRKNELKKTLLNTQKAEKKLKWRAKFNAYDVIDKLANELINSKP